MTQYALVRDGIVATVPMPVADGHALEECYHPDVVKACVQVPDAVQVGWVRGADGTFAAPVIAPPSIARLVTYAAERRYAVETGGVTVNGVSVATDRDSQSMVANAYAGMQASGATSVRFKAASGWIELSLDQLKAVALAVFDHVQACFTAEDAVDAAVNASPPTITTYAQVDAAFAGLAPKA